MIKKLKRLMGMSPKGMRVEECLDLFVDEQSKLQSWSDGTVQIFNTLEKSLSDFRPDLRIDEVDESMCAAWLDWMVAQRYENTTIDKRLSQLRWLLRWCKRKGFYDGDVLETFSPRLKGSHYEDRELVYLTEEELGRMENWPFHAGTTLDHVRDLFVFSCYTGLRFSDIHNLRKADVREGVIRVVTKKTGTSLEIQLNRHSRRIIEKYRGTKSDWLLPHEVSQVVNRHLKEIAYMLKIDTPVLVVRRSGSHTETSYEPKHQLLTFHAGRRTFVTMAVRMGIPSQVIMSWTGHTSERMLRPYLAVVNSVKEESMRKFDALGI